MLEFAHREDLVSLTHLIGERNLMFSPLRRVPKIPDEPPFMSQLGLRLKTKKTCALNLKKKNENNNNMPDKYQRITTYVIQVKNL